MKQLLKLGLFSLILTGCTADPATVALTGKWNQEFVSSDEKVQPLKGFLQLYQTENRFTLALNTKFQSIEITGMWELKDNTVQLKPGKGGFDFKSLIEEDPQSKDSLLLSSDEVTKLYQRGLNLTLDADRKVMRSLPITIGPYTGRHVFSLKEKASYGPR